MPQSINESFKVKNIEKQLQKSLQEFILNLDNNNENSLLILKEIIKRKSFLIQTGYKPEAINQVIKQYFLKMNVLDSDNEKNDKFLELLFKEKANISLETIDKNLKELIQSDQSKRSVLKFCKRLKRNINKELNKKFNALPVSNKNILQLNSKCYSHEFVGNVGAFIIENNIKYNQDITSEEFIKEMEEATIQENKNRLRIVNEQVEYKMAPQHVPDGLFYKNDKFLLIESTLMNNNSKETFSNFKHLISTLYLSKTIQENFEKYKKEIFLMEASKDYLDTINDISTYTEMAVSPESHFDKHINSHNLYQDVFNFNNSVITFNPAPKINEDIGIFEIKVRNRKINQEASTRKNSGKSIILPYFENYNLLENSLDIEKQFAFKNILKKKKPIQYYTTELDNKTIRFIKASVDDINVEETINLIKKYGEDGEIRSIKHKEKIEEFTLKNKNNQTELNNFKLNANIINKYLNILVNEDFRNNQNKNVLSSFYQEKNKQTENILCELGVLEEGYNYYDKQSAIDLNKIKEDLGVCSYLHFSTQGVRDNPDYNRYGESKFTHEEKRALITVLSEGFRMMNNPENNSVYDAEFAQIRIIDNLKHIITDTYHTSIKNKEEETINIEHLNEPQEIIKDLYKNLFLEEDRKNLKNILNSQNDENVPFKESESVLESIKTIRHAVVDSLLNELIMLEEESLTKNEKKEILTTKYLEFFNNFDIVVNEPIQDYLKKEFKISKEFEGLNSDKFKAQKSLYDFFGIKSSLNHKRRKPVS